MNFPENELVDMIFIIGECTRNCTLAARVYHERYPDRRAPSTKSLKRLMNRFIETKAVKYEKQVREKAVLHEDNEHNVLTALVENPHRSLKDVGVLLNVPQSSVHRITKKNKFHPYHLHKEQTLLERDFQPRVEFCRWAANMIRGDQNFFNRVLFTDESTFHKNGHVNRHNMHYYSNVNPHFRRSFDMQHRWSINVWGGILGDRVIGPHFFEERLTGEVYLQFLTDTLPILLEDVPLNIRRDMWFQHDGAPAHSAHEVINHLDTTFYQRWIGRGGPILWPARSPDLTKLDFFFWGHIKNIVYQREPTTPQDMQQRIREAFLSVNPNALHAVTESFRDRIVLCIEEGGHHIEYLIN